MVKKSASNKYLRSPLKWAGGKYRLLDKIIPAFPPGRRLVEPFLGSGVVFLNSAYDSYLLADLNPDLVNFFQGLRSGGEDFIKLCGSFFIAQNNNAPVFYRLRERFNSLPAGPERSAIFLYLNRHAYNGLVRYNLSGSFNTPFGCYKRPYFPQAELGAALEKLRRSDVSFAVQDFSMTFKALRPGDVVYCDPPYLALSQTANFTAYTGGGFGADAQAALAREAQAASRAGCPVVISNHATDVALELYSAASIESFEVARPISCKSAGRGRVNELIAVYRP